MKKTKLFIVLLFILIHTAVFSQTANQIISDMGAGVNIGNVYDNGVKSTSFTSVKPLIDAYQAAGMKHVRIPVTWMNSVDGDVLADYNGVINQSNQRFQDLVLTIDYALSLGLYVVLNTHHEEWLKDEYDGSQTYHDRFVGLWTQIANYFKNRSSKLIFEVLNEPEGVFGQDDGAGPWPNPGTGNTNAYTRTINEVGYNAIRATGGNNASRLIMVSPNGQSADQFIKAIWPTAADLPGDGNDIYLALSVHTYDPWGFCGQTGNNASYTSTFINNKIQGEIQQAAIDAASLGVPVNYGEFGVGRDVEQYERNEPIVKDYYKTVANTTTTNNMSFTAWDDRGWFSLINDAGTVFNYDIVPYMLQDLPIQATVTASFTANVNTAINEGENKAVEVVLNPAVPAGTNLYNIKLYLNGVKITKEENISTYNWGLEVPELTNLAAGTYTLRALVTTISTGIDTEVTTSFIVNSNSGAANTPLNLTTSYFQLVNQGTGDYLKSTSNSTTTTGVIIQENQSTPPPNTFNSFQWYFVESSWTNNYLIYNKNYALNFYPENQEVATNLTMNQSPTAQNNVAAQSWQIEPSNVEGFYWIKNRNSGLYLQPLNSSQTSATPIVQNTLTPTDATFRWQFVNVGNIITLSMADDLVDQNSTNNSIKLFPNPVHDVMTIRMPKSSGSVIELYAITGEKLLTRNVSNLDFIEINTRSYSSGVYFVKLIGTYSQSAKFIIK